MVPNYNLTGAFEKIRKQLDDMAGKNTPFNLGRANGALDYITSPLNGGIDTSLISWNSGTKVGRLKVVYDQRSKSCQVKTGTDALNAALCDARSTPEFSQKSFEVTLNNRIATQTRSFTNADMVMIMEDTEKFVRKYLLNDQRAAREALSEQVSIFLASNLGKNYQQSGSTTGAGSYTSKELLHTTAGQDVPQHANFADLLLDYSNNQLSGEPVLIGQGYLQKFYELAKYSCCNATIPYGDSVLQSSAAFFLDQAVNNVVGTNRFIMTAYGVNYLSTFNENRNINIDSEVIKHIVVPDAAGYPFEWDLDFKWDECTKKWTYMQSVYFTLFNAIQADAFAQDSSPTVASRFDCDDDLLLMNGIFGYLATKG